MSSAHLFVYGSLRRNGSGASHPLLVGADHLGNATVQGTLYRVSWYPGLVLTGDGRVHGEVFAFPPARAEAMIAALDEYEGTLYVREVAVVQLADGRTVNSFVYTYRGPTAGLPVIASGDFGVPTHRAHPDDPPQTGQD